MVHAWLMGYEYRGVRKRFSDEKKKWYVNLVLEDPEGADQISVGVPDERREDDDVRNLAKGDIVDVPISLFFGSGYTSVNLAGGIELHAEG